MALRPKNPQTHADKIAARDEAQGEAFMREVDEAVRQDQMASAAKRYGIPLGVLLVAGLAGLGGYLWWDADQTAKAEAATVQLTLAIDRIEADQPDAALDKAKPLADSKIVGLRVPAKLMEAGIAQGQGDADKAAKLYEAVIADPDAPQPMRDLALVRVVSLRYDDMKPADVVARLKPLAAPGNPFFASAAEMTAMAYVEQGKTELAGPLFAEIVRDEKAPEPMRARARQIAGLMGTDAIDDVDAVMKQIERNSAARQAAMRQTGGQ